MGRFDVGQIAGDGLVPERGGIEHFFCRQIIGLVKQRINHSRETVRGCLATDVPPEKTVENQG